MFSKLLGISIFLCATMVPVSDGASPSIVESYESAKKEIITLKANFSQKKVFTLFEEEYISDGTVWYQEPQQILWHYMIPKESKIVLNGENSWMMSPEAKQVQKISVAGGSSDRIFQILGLGNKDLKLADSFIIEPGDIRNETTYSLSLTPTDKSLTPFYTQIVIHLSSKDLFPRKVIMKETSGDITQITFSQVEINAEIDPQIFEYTVPEGFDEVV